MTNHTYLVCMDKDVRRVLDRELRRVRFGSPRSIIICTALIASVLVWLIAIPYKTEFMRGEVTGVVPHMSFNGVRQQIGVLVDGQPRSARTRARLLHPANGDIVCLRQTYYLPLPRRGLSMTDMRFCDGSIPTP